MVTNFFLGANSGAGFQELYAQFVAPEQNRDVIVLKGGPGVGKSSFMKYLGKKAEERGEDVEYIWCSGDPDSLDAVRLPRHGIIAVDGTAPHVLEPQFPAAVDRYVNLGCCYDVAALKGLRSEIEEHMRAYKAAYRRAYRALASEQEVARTLTELRTNGFDREKLLRRTRGIIRRELSKPGSGTGAVIKRYLGGLTCQGELQRYDTVETLASRIYLLCDSTGIGREMLAALADAAAAKKVDAIHCLQPGEGKGLRHLILPELSLAFLTQGEEQPYTGKVYRRIHLDALLAKDRENRAKCRFYRRTAALLRQEGAEELRRAKAHHDLLEQVYNPHVDFQRVYAMAEEEWQRIVGML